MSREKELTKNTMIVSIGRICTQCISFLLLPLYTNKLTTEEYGVVDLLNTYITLLVPIIILEIQQAVFRFLIDNRKNEEEKSKLISTTIIMSVIECIVYFLVYLLIGNLIKSQYKYFLASNVIATVFSSIMLQISRGLGDNKTYTIGSFVTATTTIIFNVVFIVAFKWGAYGMLLASFIANILCSVYIVIRLKIFKYCKIKYFDKDKLKQMLKYSIPLIPNAISWWVMSVSDRTIITAVLNIGMNGIYSAANKFSAIFSTISNIFSITWTESTSMHINDSDGADYFSNVINKVFKFFSCLCVGMISVIPFAFPILIGKSYAEAYYQIPILLLGGLCNAMVLLLSSIYIAKKMTKKVAQTSIISAIINIVVNLALIKFIGLYAASISTFIAYFSMMIIRMKDIKKYIDIKFDQKTLIEIAIVNIMVCVSYYINNMILNVICFILVLIYCFVVNRKDVMSIIEMVLKRKSK